MGIPAPLPDRQAASRRRAPALEHRAGKRREADTILPVSRWNLISAPLFGFSCRQKTAEQNYYNWFSRIETVPSWFAVEKKSEVSSPRDAEHCSAGQPWAAVPTHA